MIEELAECVGAKFSIKRRSLATLSAGVSVASVPPMSVRTQPGLTTTE